MALKKKRDYTAEEFEAAWNSSESVSDFCKKTGFGRVSATGRAVYLRMRGLKLKMFGQGTSIKDWAALRAEAEKHSPVPTASLVIHDPFKFVRIWQRAKSGTEVAQKMGMKTSAASEYARRLRAGGVGLKFFKHTRASRNTLLGELKKYAQGHGTPTWMIVSAQSRQIRKLEGDLDALRKKHAECANK